MELSSITIENYKSIKSPITIDLSTDNKLFTFIGKNGSGKTNILTAIKNSLSRPSYYASRDMEIPISSTTKINFTKDDFKLFFDKKNKDELITVKYDTSTTNSLKTATAPFLNELISYFKNELIELLKLYKKTKNSYIKKIKQLEDCDNQIIYSVEPSVTVNGKIRYRIDIDIEQNEEKIKNNIEQINEYLNKYFVDNKLSITPDNNYYYFKDEFNLKLDDIRFLDENKISISPIVAKSLNLSSKDIDEGNIKLNKEIKKINKLIENDFGVLNNTIHKINDIRDKIYYMFSDGNQIAEEYWQVNIKKFYEALKDTCYRNTYFIDNEHSLLFREIQNDYGENRVSPQYMNNIQNPIIQAFDNYLKEHNFYKSLGTDDNGKDIYESIHDLSKLTKQRQTKLINFLNTNLFSSFKPAFEKKEIQNYQLNIEDNKLSLWVVEKDGTKINFDDTSLGRRWYLTYKIISTLVQPGDLLFIDEPAAFLHPNAQVEFRRELECLSERGIYVFITTHSPYMINTAFDNVYNVTIDKKSTQANLIKTKDSILPIIQDEIGVVRTNDILFELSNTILFVEGITDEACLIKFADILNFDLTDYKITVCYGSPIIHLAYLCEEQGIKYKALLDLDNLKKPESFLSKHTGYIEYLKTLTNNPNCVCTPNKGTKTCIEDCFEGEDVDRYLSPKVNINKLKSGQVFTKETKDNFEQLFTQLGIPHIDNKDKK